MVQAHQGMEACCTCPACLFTCADCMGKRAHVVPKGEDKLPPGIASHLAQYRDLEEKK